MHNPEKGWVMIDHALPGELDAGKSVERVRDGTAYEWFPNVAVLSTWAAVEPRRGEFDWSLMDKALAYWGGLGKTLHLRFSTENFGTIPGCPDWLFALGVPRFVDGEKHSFPDYTHPVYREELRRFMAVFGRRFCNDPRLGSIDLRAYGEWGEWHSGHGYPTVEARRQALGRLIDAWRKANRGRKWLNLSASYEWQARGNTGRALTPQGLSIYEWPGPTYDDYRVGSSFDRSFLFPDVTLRRDGVGGAVKMEYDGRLMAAFFAQQRKPLTMEAFGGLDAYVNGRPHLGFPDTRPGDDFVQNVVDEMISHHANYATAIGWLASGGATDFYNQYRFTILEAHKAMGYRFVLLRAAFPDSVAPGGTLWVEQAWENRAHGRCYKRHPLRLSLRRDGQVVWESAVNDLDQRNWTTGETYNVCSQAVLPAGLAPGQYDLCLRMAAEHGLGNLRLAVVGGEKDGVFRVGTVQIAPEAPALPGLTRPVKVRRNGSRWTAESQVAPSDAVLLSFEYQVTRNPDQDLHTENSGFFRFFGLDEQGRRWDETRWFDSAGQPFASKTCLLTGQTNLLLRPCWESVSGGAMHVRNVRAERIPAEAWRRLWIHPESRQIRVDGGADFEQADRVAVERDRSQVRLPDNWWPFLKTRPEAFPLRPDTTYTVFFDSTMRPQIWQGDYAYLSVFRVAHTNAAPAFRWTQRHTASPVRRAYSFHTGPESDYQLVWGVKNGGRCAVANVVLLER